MDTFHIVCLPSSHDSSFSTFPQIKKKVTPFKPQLSKVRLQFLTSLDQTVAVSYSFFSRIQSHGKLCTLVSKRMSVCEMLIEACNYDDFSLRPGLLFLKVPTKLLFSTNYEEDYKDFHSSHCEGASANQWKFLAWKIWSQPDIPLHGRYIEHKNYAILLAYTLLFLVQIWYQLLNILLGVTLLLLGGSMIFSGAN